MHYKGRSELTYQIFIHVIVGLVALSSLFPLIYVLGTSLTTQSELIHRNYFVIIPHAPTLAAYEQIFNQGAVPHALLVSVVRSVLGTFLTLLFTMVGAYVLARKSLPGRGILLLMVLVTILFNGGMIPTYLVVKQFGMLNSLWSLIIPGLVDSFGLLVIKIFVENLPDGVMESARIDGAGDVRLLTHIVIPLAAPALAAIGLFDFVGHWNSWFDALLYISNQNLYPLQLVLRNILMFGAGGTNDQTLANVLASSQMVDPYSIQMATVLIGVIPVICIYPFIQKHFIKGVYLGAVKG